MLDLLAMLHPQFGVNLQQQHACFTAASASYWLLGGKSDGQGVSHNLFQGLVPHLIQARADPGASCGPTAHAAASRCIRGDRQANPNYRHPFGIGMGFLR